MKCKGYRNSRDHDSIVCAMCCRNNRLVYTECIRLTQDKIDKNNKRHESSGISLVLFDSDNNTLKDIMLTRKQLKDINDILEENYGF